MRRNSTVLVGVAALLLAGLAACGGDGKPTASRSGLPTPVSVGPAEAPPVSVPSSSDSGLSAQEAAEDADDTTGAADDPPGAIACAQLAEAMAAGTLMVPGVTDRIVEASQSADAPLADAADRLAAAYRTAKAAKDKPDEPDKIAAVGAAASDMSEVCVESGLRAAG